MIPAAAKRYVQDVWLNWNKPAAPIRWKTVLGILIGGLLLTPLVYRLPLLGFDWHRLFYLGFLDQYPPWMIPLFAPFRLLDWRWSLALVNSLSLMAVAATTAAQSRRVVWEGLGAAALALLTPPLWYMLWDGQIDGLVLISLLILPISLPLVLLRPQIIGWLLLSKRTWFIGLIAWVSLSFLVWGNWLTELLDKARGSIIHPTAIGWATLGWPILVLGLAMWLEALRRGDPWRLLAAGMVAAPYIQPYHTIILLPVLGRLKGYPRLIVWLLAWVVGLVPGLLGISRYLALLFPIAIWWFLKDEPDHQAVEPVEAST
jgi:hypothetical protein